MLNFGQLTRAVQENCDISDAQFAQNYSLCTFLLKMREYFRWEHELPLTAALDKETLGRWLARREQHWDTLADRPFLALPVAEQTLDAFASDDINARINPAGYVYSGGYGLFGKPQFFLGALLRIEHHAATTVYVSGCEYARELSAPPAMALGHTVFVRRESLRRLLWEKIEEWRLKQNSHTPLARALACYPADADIERTLERMTDNETDSLILHELGEVRAGDLLGPRWEELLARLTRSKAEYLARAVRDHLADCLVTLPELIARDNSAALHFYFANFTGLRRELFPEAQAAYLRWVGGANISTLRAAADAGAEHWARTAQRLLDRDRIAPDNIQLEIEAEFAPERSSTVSCAR